MGGIDFTEVFAPLSQHTTLRTLPALAAAYDSNSHQLDIKTAFLNGGLEKTIYISATRRLCGRRNRHSVPLEEVSLWLTAGT